MTSLVQSEAADGTVQLATVRERHLKAPIVLAAATVLLALLFLLCLLYTSDAADE